MEGAALSAPYMGHDGACPSKRKQPKTGFEPVTYGLRNRCSTN
jgi:hypothetical protein